MSDNKTIKKEDIKKIKDTINTIMEYASDRIIDEVIWSNLVVLQRDITNKL
jgi:hypothetical protein